MAMQQLRISIALLIFLSFSLGWVLCKVFHYTKWEGFDKAMCALAIASTIGLQMVMP